MTVLAVDEQQIEQEEDERALPGVAGILNEIERRPAVRQQPAKLAIQVCVLGRQPADDLGDGGILPGPVVAPAR